MGKIYIKSGLTGGSANDMDGIRGNLLSHKDICFVFSSGGTFMPFMLNETSGADESAPNIISPDIDPDNKRWEKFNL